jgi:uncharacterized protein
MTGKAPWANRYVIVSGGSAGLGLHLVRELAMQGANIGIVGRDVDRLLSAAELARGLGAPSTMIFSIQLANKSTDEQSQRKFVDSIRGWLNGRGLDLLVNAVGRSDRGHLAQLSVEELENMFRDNVLTHWQMTHFVFDELKSAGGTVVNIGSLAGIIATPNLGAYCVSKSALVQLTRQWRQELKASGIHMMLVCPGPIDRDDVNERYSELVQSRGLASATAAPGGGAKIRLLDPAGLSAEILDAAAKRKYELIRPRKAVFLAAMANLWPAMADRLLQRFMKK